MRPPTAVRILVAYVTAGAGHRRAAEALGDALRKRLPHADVHCHDVLRDAPRWFHSGYAATYLFLVRRAPWIWKFSYAFLDHKIFYRCVQPLRRLWNCFVVRRWMSRLKAHPYDVILMTHFLPADLCSAGRRAGWLKSGLVTVVTDYHPHRFWIFPEPDAVVVSVPESAGVLHRRGVEPSRIHVIGIPVSAAFSKPVDEQELRVRLGLTSGRQPVLVTSGGTTVGQFEAVVAALRTLEKRLPGKLELLVVCGQDAQVRARLQEQSYDGGMPVHVFGFVDFMPDLMAVSRLTVSKAGGLTISESLARGVPLVLYHVIPGQEEMNAQIISRQGAAFVARSPADVGAAALRFFSDPAMAHGMRAAVSKLRHPDAAARIVEEVVIPLIEKIHAASG